MSTKAAPAGSAEAVAKAFNAYRKARQRRLALERKAGVALVGGDESPGAAYDSLSNEADFFASEDWGTASLEEIAAAGGRIERAARKLIAARDVPEARREEMDAIDEFRKARGLEKEE